MSESKSLTTQSKNTVDIAFIEPNQSSQIQSVQTATVNFNNSLITPDVERNVLEFSRCTALYTMLIISLGTMRDSGKLRDDINTVRQRGWELANYNKSLLVPRMRQASEDPKSNMSESNPEEYKNLERVFFMFCSCLEFFMEQLLRTVDLLGSFQLNSSGLPNHEVFVNSGLTDSMPGCLYLRAAASSISVSPLSSPVPSTVRRHSAFNFRFNTPRLKNPNSQVSSNKQNILLNSNKTTNTINSNEPSKSEQQELLLKKDIKALKELILEIHSSIAMTPWTIQPQYHIERFHSNGDSLASLADSSDEESLHSSTYKYNINLDEKDGGGYSIGVNSSKLLSSDKNCEIDANKHRCIIITITIVVCTIFVIALGVCVRLLV